MNNPLLQSVQLALHNGAQAEAIELIDKVVDFCIKHENGKVLGDAPKEYIRLLVAYNIAKDTIVVEQDENKNVTGLMVWYKCNKDDGDSFFLNWDEDKVDGDAIFGALLFAKDTKTFQSIFKNFISKCPEVKQKQFMGLRYRSGVKTLVKYTNKFFDKILNK